MMGLKPLISLTLIFFILQPCLSNKVFIGNPVSSKATLQAMQDADTNSAQKIYSEDLSSEANKKEDHEQIFLLSKILPGNDMAVVYTDSMTAASFKARDNQTKVKGSPQKGVQLYYLGDYTASLQDTIKNNRTIERHVSQQNQLRLLNASSVANSKNYEKENHINPVSSQSNKITVQEAGFRDLNENNIFRKNILIVLLTGASLVLFPFFWYAKKRTDGKRLNIHLPEISIKPYKSTEQKSLDIHIEDTNHHKTNPHNLSENLVEEILFRLNNFEKSNRFIKKNYTLIDLAKELKTNSSYLSKVVNQTKNINFSQYLNNLRVSYTIERLSTDSQLRSYTIKAIAEESGFNTAQSFSSAFHKITGSYPSDFLKQLEKKLENSTKESVAMEEV